MTQEEISKAAEAAEKLARDAQLMRIDYTGKVRDHNRAFASGALNTAAETFESPMPVTSPNGDERFARPFRALDADAAHHRPRRHRGGVKELGF